MDVSAAFDLYFDELEPIAAQPPKAQLVLVFSERHPDGARLTSIEYRRLTQSMSAFDRSTHVAVDVDEGLERAEEQAVFLKSVRRTK